MNPLHPDKITPHLPMYTIRTRWTLWANLNGRLLGAGYLHQPGWYCLHFSALLLVLHRQRFVERLIEQ